jgi:thioester reductase-like protein
MAEATKQSRRDEAARARADAALDCAIRPEGAAARADPNLYLLTGASGFLGRQVARELLRVPGVRLVCLMRGTTKAGAADRLAGILESVGIDRATTRERVEVQLGDIAEADLGLDAESYRDLAERVEAIYHCAAMVDWVRSYGQLFRMNVGGVLSLIKLACKVRTKRMVFVSSIAVCFAQDGPEHVDEDTDMLPFIDGMPLGYARSKCVAESLLRQAAKRGLPVTVLRPALIAGDSSSGIANPEDMIAALFQGCIATGMAMDTDWLLDCVPVDFVARVMACVPQGDSCYRVLNLMHERPRHWRELILWINLHGYPVSLVKSEEWVRHLFDYRHSQDTMLYAQRRFFRGSPSQEGEDARAKPYEVYLAASQRKIDASATRRLLKHLGLNEAPLDADLLHAYFDYYRGAGVLPQRGLVELERQDLDEIWHGTWYPVSSGLGLERWRTAAFTRISSDDSLLSEIAAARVKGGVGLWRLDLAKPGAKPAKAVLKAKASDQILTDLTVKLVDVCRSELGSLFARFPDALGLVLSHERELGLYEWDEPALRRHMPSCYGTLRDTGAGRWAMLLEYLPECEMGWPRLRADDENLGAVLSGLADIHAVGFLRQDDLANQGWLLPMPDPARMAEMTPLWRELADFALPWIETWCGGGIGEFQEHCLANLTNWWPRLQAMPTTLIHNDFNPRNFVIREADGHPWLCVFDWELATLGPPQHDLAELLCFIWHDALTENDLDKIVESYRMALSQACQREFDPAEWREGFALTLRYLLLNRFAMYMLMYRFRPLDYLPRVMANWAALERYSQRWVGQTS